MVSRHKILALLIILAGLVAFVNFSKGEMPGEAEARLGPYPVLRVIDGDTFSADIDGTETVVRLIGVNTPELREKECFAVEASNRTSALISGKEVYLEYNTPQKEHDEYGRLLAYVYIEGELLNKMLIEEGYGEEYYFSYKYQKEFKEAEQVARNSEAGIWSAVCR